MLLIAQCTSGLEFDTPNTEEFILPTSRNTISFNEAVTSGTGTLTISLHIE
jgi:hypothetical protein